MDKRPAGRARIVTAAELAAEVDRLVTRWRFQQIVAHLDDIEAVEPDTAA